MMKTDKPVFVTQPFLPPLEEFQQYLKEIWDSKWLTNDGSYHKKLEAALCSYLGVKYVSLFANGTLALIAALRALHITGEVITTPFSFVATAHALWWNSIKPVFVDIEQGTAAMDPRKIEAAITPRTTAILPVHVYGNPCNVSEIGEIAGRYGLKVIYDACPAFGVNVGGQSLLEFGDLSALSFHATKVFTTFEGGAIVSHSEAMKRQIDNLKNFGYINEISVITPGINAKMNEFQAGLGLLQLKYVDENIAERQALALQYRTALSRLQGVSFFPESNNTRYNYGTLPILVDETKFGNSRDWLYEKLKRHNIIARRYYYPLISEFPTYSGLESSKPGSMPVAEEISRQVLCVPIYPGLEPGTVQYICDLIGEKSSE